MSENITRTIAANDVVVNVKDDENILVTNTGTNAVVNITEINSSQAESANKIIMDSNGTVGTVIAGAGDTLEVNSGKVTNVRTENANVTINVNSGTVATVTLGTGMTTIGGANGTVSNAVGAAAADKLTVTGGNVTNVTMGAGADSLTFTGGTITKASMGDDDDSIIIRGGTGAVNAKTGVAASAQILGEAGNDNFVIEANGDAETNVTLIGGAGNDKYTVRGLNKNGKYIIQGTANTVSRGVIINNQDIIDFGEFKLSDFDVAVNGTSLILTSKLEASKDATVTIVGWGNGYFSAISFADGKSINYNAKNLYDFSESSTTQTQGNIHNFGVAGTVATVNMTAGDDAYSNTGTTTTVNMGAGNDIVNMNGGKITTLNTGAGQDTVVLKSGTIANLQMAGAGESGPDKLTVKSEDESSNGVISALKGTEGTDNLVLESGTVSKATLGNGADEVIVSGGKNTTILGEAGDDVFTIQKGETGSKAVNVVLQGGQNNDTYKVLSFNPGDSYVIQGTANTAATKTTAAINNVDTLDLSGMVKVSHEAPEADEYYSLSDFDVSLDASNNLILTSKVEASLGATLTVKGWGAGQVIVKFSDYESFKSSDILTVSGKLNGYDFSEYANGFQYTNRSNVTGAIAFGEGSDNINMASGTVNTITAGDGNDQVNMTGSTVTELDFGDGTDTLNLYGGTIKTAALGRLTEAATNDTANIHGGTVTTLVMSGGDNAVLVDGGSVGTAYMGEGADVITVKGQGKVGTINTAESAGGSTNIVIAAGDDGAAKYAGAVTTITGGSAVEHIDMSAGTLGTVNFGEGNDSAAITGGKVTNFNLEAGNNTVSITGNAVVTNVVGGSGEDEITVDGSAAVTAIKNGLAGKVDNGGVENVIVKNGRVATVDLGVGADSLKVTGGSVTNAKLGDGENSALIQGGTVSTLVGGTDADEVNVSGGTVSNLQLGSGENRATISDGTVGTLTGGADADTLQLTGGTLTKASLGAGNDVVTVSGGKNSTIMTDAGNDEFSIKAGESGSKASNVTLQGGAGNDTYTVAALNAGDSYIVKGTGIGANQDTLDVSGFGIGDFDYLLNGTNLVLFHKATKATITVQGWNADAAKSQVLVKLAGDAYLDNTESTAKVKDISSFTAVNGNDNVVEIAGAVVTNAVNLNDAKATAATNNAVDIANGAKVNTLTSSAGTDNITVGENATLTTLAIGQQNRADVGGVEKLTVNGGAVGTANLGAGNDTLTVNDGKVTTANLGAGDDIAAINGGTVTTIQAVSGANAITVDGGVVTTIVGGTDRDKYVIGGSKRDMTQVTTINAASGSGKTLNVKDGVLGTANLSAVSDTAEISDGLVKTLNMNAGDDTLTISNGVVAKASMGVGNDTINITGSGVDYSETVGNKTTVYKGITVYGDAGDDTFNISGGKIVTVSGGAGSDVYNLTKLEAGGSYTIINTDYANGDGDLIDFSKLLKAEGVPPTYFSSGDFTYSLDASGALLMTTKIDGQDTTIKITGFANNRVLLQFTDAVLTGADIDFSTNGDAVDNTSDNKLTAAGGKMTNVTFGGGADTFNIGTAAIPKSESSPAVAATAGTVATANMGAGDDTVAMENGTLGTLNLDSGNNKVTIGSSDNAVKYTAKLTTLNAGLGDDTVDVTAKGSIVTANLSGGTDTLNVNGGTVTTVNNTGNTSAAINLNSGKITTINGANGVETVNVAGGTLGTANFGGGADSLTVATGTSGTAIAATVTTATMGAGNDTVTVSGGKNTATNKFVEGKITTLNLSAGKNTVNLENYGVIGTLNAGTGTDTLNVSGGTLTTLNGTMATEKLNVSGGVVNTANLGAGRDVVEISGGTVTTLDVGSGNDDVTITGGTVTNLKLNNGANTVSVGGNGRVTNLTLGAGTDTVVVKDHGFVQSFAGSAADNSLTVQDDAVVNTVNMAAGDDVLNFKGGEIKTANMGAGNDEININGAAAGTINGEAGNDVFNITASGQLTLRGGAGNDTYNISSFKSDSIYRINNADGGADDIDLSGFKFTEFDVVYNNDELRLQLNSDVGGHEGANGAQVIVTGWSKKTTSIRFDGETKTFADITNSSKAMRLTVESGTVSSLNLAEDSVLTVAGGAISNANVQTSTVEINKGSITTLEAGKAAGPAGISAFSLAPDGSTINVDGTGSIKTLKLTSGSNAVNLIKGSITELITRENNGPDYIEVSGGTLTTLSGNSNRKEAGIDANGKDVEQLTISGSGKVVTANLGYGADSVTMLEKGTLTTLNVGNDAVTVDMQGGTITTLNMTGNTGDSVDNKVVVKDASAGATAGTISTVNGTEQNDILTVSGGNIVTANMKGGNDSVTVSGGKITTLDAGAGDDTIEISGTGEITTLKLTNGANTVNMSGGKVTNFNVGAGVQVDKVTSADAVTVTGGEITNYNGGNFADTLSVTDGTITKAVMGNGNDTLTVAGNSRITTVDMGAGNDTLNVSGTSTLNAVSMGAGNDDITVGAGSTITTLDAGAGNDTITVAGAEGNEGVIETLKLNSGNNTLNLNAGGKVNNLTLGSGADTVNLNGGTLGGYTANAGNNTLAVSAGTVAAANMLAGNDRLEVSGGSVTSADLGVGNDTAEITGGNVGTLIAGAGNDTIMVSGSGTVVDDLQLTTGTNTVTISGGATVNKLTVGNSAAGNRVDAADIVTISGGTVGEYVGSAYNDKLEAGTGVSLGNVNMEAGNDSLKVIGGNVTGAVNMGAGNDTLEIRGAAVGGNIDLGAGNDTITIAADAAGNESSVSGNIKLGAGEDKLYLENASTIADLDATEGKNQIFLKGTASAGAIAIGSGSQLQMDGSAAVTSITGNDTGAKITMNGGTVGNITMGTGKDTVTIGGTVSGEVNTGAGDDVVTVNAGASIDTLTLGAGNDVLNSSGDITALELSSGAGAVHNLNGGTITTLTGNDTTNTVTVDGATVTAGNMGAGDDTLTVKSGTVTMDMGNGDNTISINGGTVNITAGTGADDIEITGGTATVDSGAGYDDIKITGGTATIDAGAGKDNITVSGGQGHTLTGGAGSDTYSIDWSKTSGTITINNTAGDGYAAGDVDSVKITGMNVKNVSFSDPLGENLTITDKTDATKKLVINGWNSSALNSKVNIGGKDYTADDIQKIIDGGLIRITSDKTYTSETLAADANEFKISGTGTDVTFGVDAGAPSKHLEFIDYGPNVGYVYTRPSDNGDLHVLKLVDTSGTVLATVTDYGNTIGNITLSGENIAMPVLPMLVDGIKYSSISVGGAGADTLSASTDSSNVYLKGGAGADAYNISWKNSGNVVIDNSDRTGSEGDTVSITGIDKASLLYNVSGNKLVMSDGKKSVTIMGWNSSISAVNVGGVSVDDSAITSIINATSMEITAKYGEDDANVFVDNSKISHIKVMPSLTATTPGSLVLTGGANSHVLDFSAFEKEGRQLGCKYSYVYDGNSVNTSAYPKELTVTLYSYDGGTETKLVTVTLKNYDKNMETTYVSYNNSSMLLTPIVKYDGSNELTSVRTASANDDTLVITGGGMSAGNTNDGYGYVQSYTDLSDGNDTVTIGHDWATDTLNSAGTAYTSATWGNGDYAVVVGGAGDDTFYVNNAINSTVEGGAGKDTYYVDMDELHKASLRIVKMRGSFLAEPTEIKINNATSSNDGEILYIKNATRNDISFNYTSGDVAGSLSGQIYTDAVVIMNEKTYAGITATDKWGYYGDGGDKIFIQGWTNNPISKIVFLDASGNEVDSMTKEEIEVWAKGQMEYSISSAGTTINRNTDYSAVSGNLSNKEVTLDRRYGTIKFSENVFTGSSSTVKLTGKFDLSINDYNAGESDYGVMKLDLTAYGDKLSMMQTSYSNGVTTIKLLDERGTVFGNIFVVNTSEYNAFFNFVYMDKSGEIKETGNHCGAANNYSRGEIYSFGSGVTFTMPSSASMSSTQYGAEAYFSAEDDEITITSATNKSDIYLGAGNNIAHIDGDYNRVYGFGSDDAGKESGDDTFYISGTRNTAIGGKGDDKYIVNWSSLKPGSVNANIIENYAGDATDKDLIELTGVAYSNLKFSYDYDKKRLDIYDANDRHIYVDSYTSTGGYAGIKVGSITYTYSQIMDNLTSAGKKEINGSGAAITMGSSDTLVVTAAAVGAGGAWERTVTDWKYSKVLDLSAYADENVTMRVSNLSLSDSGSDTYNDTKVEILNSAGDAIGTILFTGNRNYGERSDILLVKYNQDSQMTVEISRWNEKTSSVLYGLNNAMTVTMNDEYVGKYGSELFASAGNDTITANHATAYTIRAGAGDDTITVNASSTDTASWISGGTGADTIHVNAAGVHVATNAWPEDDTSVTDDTRYYIDSDGVSDTVNIDWNKITATSSTGIVNIYLDGGSDVVNITGLNFAEADIISYTKRDNYNMTNMLIIRKSGDSSFTQVNIRNYTAETNATIKFAGGESMSYAEIMAVATTGGGSIKIDTTGSFALGASTQFIDLAESSNGTAWEATITGYSTYGGQKIGYQGPTDTANRYIRWADDGNKYLTEYYLDGEDAVLKFYKMKEDGSAGTLAGTLTLKDTGKTSVYLYFEGGFEAESTGSTYIEKYTTSISISGTEHKYINLFDNSSSYIGASSSVINGDYPDNTYKLTNTTTRVEGDNNNIYGTKENDVIYVTGNGNYILSQNGNDTFIISGDNNKLNYSGHSTPAYDASTITLESGNGNYLVGSGGATGNHSAKDRFYIKGGSDNTFAGERGEDYYYVDWSSSSFKSATIDERGDSYSTNHIYLQGVSNIDDLTIKNKEEYTNSVITITDTGAVDPSKTITFNYASDGDFTLSCVNSSGAITTYTKNDVLGHVSV